MTTMQAIAKHSDRPDALALTEVPIPQPGPHDLLVRVRAIGVGIHDGYFLPENLQYPYAIGIEAAGVIEAVGDNVSRFKVGQAVAFVSAMQPKGGTWAEFAVVEEHSIIVPVPSGMSFVQAAAVPVAGNTVLKAFHALQLKPTDSLFIAGASGAIGSFAIQLAAERGCVVVSSASANNHDYMRSLGAATTVDYRDVDWTEQVKQCKPGGVDAALAIPPGTANDSMTAVRDGGCVVIVSGDQVSAQRDIRTAHIPHHIDIQSELAQLMEKIASGAIKLEIEQVYSFTDGVAALEKTQTRHARGKVVIEMPQDH